MRQVGARRETALVEQASGLLLAEGSRFNEAVSHLARTTFIPNGVYRFSSHEAANRHAQDFLVHGMAMLAAERALEIIRARARRDNDDDTET